MSSWCTFGLDPGGLDGLKEPDDGLGGRFTLGSVAGALATPPKVHHMDRWQKRGGAGRLAAAFLTHRLITKCESGRRSFPRTR